MKLFFFLVFGLVVGFETRIFLSDRAEGRKEGGMLESG